MRRHLAGHGAPLHKEAEFHIQIQGIGGQIRAGNEQRAAIRHRTFDMQQDRVTVGGQRALRDND